MELERAGSGAIESMMVVILDASGVQEQKPADGRDESALQPQFYRMAPENASLESWKLRLATHLRVGHVVACSVTLNLIWTCEAAMRLLA